VEDAAHGNSERGRNTGAPPVSNAAPENVKRVGAGREVEQDASGDEQEKIVNAQHGY